MNIRLAFRNMEHKPELEEYAQKELVKLNTFFQPHDATVYIDLVMDVEGVDHRNYYVELRVNDKHGQLVSHERGRDVYGAILQVVKKMEVELAKGKSRRLDLRDKPHDDVAPLRNKKLDFEK